VASFQPYDGRYLDGCEAVRWSCYATSHVYELRRFDDRLAEPPPTRRWIMAADGRGGRRFAFLVDDDAADFSQILPQIRSVTAALAA